MDFYVLVSSAPSMKLNPRLDMNPYWQTFFQTSIEALGTGRCVPPLCGATRALRQMRRMRRLSHLSQNCRHAGLVERRHHWRLLAAVEHAGEKTSWSPAGLALSCKLCLPSVPASQCLPQDNDSLACFLQVHKWMLRHVYYPAMRVGVPKVLAGVLVFFVSAVFHELLVGLPLHMLKAWSFIGIMSQARIVFPRSSMSGLLSCIATHLQCGFDAFYNCAALWCMT